MPNGNAGGDSSEGESTYLPHSSRSVSSPEAPGKSPSIKSTAPRFEETYDVPEYLWDMEQVSDWTKRIASYTPEQRKFYNEMVPKMQELKSIMKSTAGDWKLIVDKKEQDLLIETKKSVRGLTICRGQGHIDWPPIDVWRCMCNAKFKPEWDINNDGVKFHKKIGANAYIYYSRTKSKTGFTARDFIMNYICNLEADGTVIVTCSSFNCDFKLREQHGATRGEIAIGGILLEPVKGDPKKTKAYVMQEADLKTSLPAYILRSAFRDQGMQIERIRSVLPKWKEQFPNERP